MNRDVTHAALDKPVEMAHRFAWIYSGSGDQALVNGLQAAPHYRDPSWQGYYGDDLVVTIDLGEPTLVKTVDSSFLQELAPGIFLPPVVEYLVSDDGSEFRSVAEITHTVPLESQGPLVHQFSAKLEDVRARYVRIRARNVKTIPAGHQAAGGKAWLFADEIRVNP